MCERFHRDMKASLKASLTDDGWVDRLPWVTLGIRTVPKEDLLSSSALVYGQTLRVPGDFIPRPTVPWSASDQRRTLLDAAQSFLPIPTSHHCVPQVHVPPDLRTAGFVFIRHDAHRAPLQPPYDGPFRVVEAGDKTFLVDIGGRLDHVSVDRLKPAHLDLGRSVEVAQAPRRGRPPGGAALERVPPPLNPPHCRPPPARRHRPPVAPPPHPSLPAQELRNSFGRVIRVPGRFTGPVLVNSGGTCVVDVHTQDN